MPTVVIQNMVDNVHFYIKYKLSVSSSCPICAVLYRKEFFYLIKGYEFGAKNKNCYLLSGHIRAALSHGWRHYCFQR